MCLVSALTLSSIPKGTGNTINFNGAVNISIQEATWDVQVHHSISLKGKTCGSLDAEPVSSSSSSSSSSGSNPGNSNAVWSEDFNGMATNFSGKGSKVNQFRISLPPANEYTLNYKLYFEKNWTFYQGGKFHGFVPDKTVTGFRATEPDGWSGRITISGKKPTLYLYDQKRGGVSNAAYHPITTTRIGTAPCLAHK